ncbi:MAG: glycine cleavage system aminomethyltransferase GcvT [Gammaproteobacteria bacterium]|nr:glycine cleavage system aminomethyltransferase GcvT [Gammaproteobacteria bacterium]MDH3372171.1 glycine cleavage system aminomethyltransferase GcvT [Gammaproteobacteria bacterium]MDH3408863.1 glycine cleavage system aminomethyltransferase GcvT [Gammaproteobacteria bacterium]MDH3551331.1 glycine cleavage system aminomethyltransferase GcvT [Gammaproteobacteria bacterium]
MGLKTPLYGKHVEAGARIVDFGGWDMPLHYGSQKEEHHAVRTNAGLFDVSHMTIVDLKGGRVRDLLRHLLANDVAKLKDSGKALYTCMLNEDGGVIDDLIVYFMHDSWFRMVVNAATRDKDLAWIRRHAESYDVKVIERAELAMLAVQGPKAREIAAPCVDAEWREQALDLELFTGMEAGDLFVARTGYTGEDGWEILLPAMRAPSVWDRLVAGGVAPAGLGARDTLRLEAAMNLYGSDMDETISPLEAGLGWTVAWDPDERDFIGRGSLEKLRADATRRRFVGLLLEDKGVLRNHQRVVVDGVGDGEITSGGFSPTIGRSIALARLPAGDYDRAKVEVRGKLLNVRIVKTPFVRNGQIRIDV